MFLKFFGLFLINLITYPFVLLVAGGFFLTKRITWIDFFGKCGFVPLKNVAGKEYIWFHVSSLGEWNTGKIFAKHLQEKSGHPLLITYFNGDLTFPIMKEIQEKKFLTLGSEKLFLPVENAFSFWLIHRHYRVRAVIILETEIWPTLILMSYWLKKPIFLVNAVLFSKETRNLFLFKIIFTPTLRCFSHIYCVSEKARMNFLKLGVCSNNVTVIPNFKYDIFGRVKNLEKISKFRKNTNSDKWGEIEYFFYKQKKNKRKIIVFASFHGEEFKKILPKVDNFLKNTAFTNILAPRDISPKVLKFLEKYLQERELSYIKRSELGHLSDFQGSSNLILDSFGELSSIYSIVDLVIMGGSFIPVGGHNFLEAIFFDKKIFMGKFIHHYEDFVDNFKEYIHMTNSTTIERDIDSFFLKKRLKGLGGGSKIIKKFSGSSLKVANIINKKINFYYSSVKIF